MVAGIEILPEDLGRDSGNIVLPERPSKLIALTRAVPPTLADCELTHIRRTAVNLRRAVEQHRRYEEALVELGCVVRRLPETPALPDSVFVEDTAVVLPELAIITRPGAASRRAETASVAKALAAYRVPLAFIRAPGTLDGGDVLYIDRCIYVGRSSRTNAAGLRQLEDLVSPHDYRVRAVAVSGCLHLKSAVTAVAEHTVLINPAWAEAGAFAGFEQIIVHPAEPCAANALRIGAAVIYAESWHRTRQRIEEHGIRVRPVETGELAKAEAGVSCCSILLP
jgi:dimethylargininase